jgi:deazaflavin-dependent oxidoreductase (nitroreductase family)
MLILTSVGRRTGRRRSTPVYFVPDAGDYVVIASNGGEDRYPGWWYNIRANPEVEIEIGRRRFACTARRVEDTADAARLFSRLSAVFGGYQGYRRRTKRELTLFRLTPSSGPT